MESISKTGEGNTDLGKETVTNTNGEGTIPVEDPAKQKGAHLSTIH